MKGLSLTTEKG